MQKFSRIGAREFVPFAEYEDLTLANIKLACEKYFSNTVGKSVVCDVLASEQGPSCSTLEQVPDLRLIHIRFIQLTSSNKTTRRSPIQCFSPQTPGRRKEQF